MIFIWRGAGIIVPIIFFICGWVVSYWIDDTRLGNSDFLGWTAFYAGIFCFILGLGFIGSKEDEFQDMQPGEIPVKKKHDFFWIPVIIWGVLFLVWSAYLLMGDSEESEYESDYDVEQLMDEDPTTRIINFYNPNEDTMSYLIEDLGDFEEVSSVSPNSYVSTEVDMNTYWIVGFDHEDELVLTYPHEDFRDDKSKYKLVEEEVNGEMIKYFQRIIEPATEDKRDYDEAWVVLDGDHDLVLVDVSETCNDTIKKGTMRHMDWLELVENVYDGHDVIEPLYEKRNGSKTFTVLPPGKSIPLDLDKKEVVYCLVPIKKGKKLTNEYLAEMLIGLNNWE